MILNLGHNEMYDLLGLPKRSETDNKIVYGEASLEEVIAVIGRAMNNGGAYVKIHDTKNLEETWEGSFEEWVIQMRRINTGLRVLSADDELVWG